MSLPSLQAGQAPDFCNKMLTELDVDEFKYFQQVYKENEAFLCAEFDDSEGPLKEQEPTDEVQDARLSTARLEHEDVFSLLFEEALLTSGQLVAEAQAEEKRDDEVLLPVVGSLTLTADFSSPSVEIRPESDPLNLESDQAREFRCPVEGCGRSFDTKNGLGNHRRIHSSSHCPVRKKAFSPKQDSFVCPMRSCKKSFKQKSNLNAHLRIHTGDNKYYCPRCKKGFKWKSSYNAHSKKLTRCGIYKKD